MVSMVSRDFFIFLFLFEMVSVFFGKVFLFSIAVFFAFSTCGDDPKASTVPGECPHQAGPYGNEKTVTRSGQKIFLEIPIEGMLLYVYLIYCILWDFLSGLLKNQEF